MRCINLNLFLPHQVLTLLHLVTRELAQDLGSGMILFTACISEGTLRHFVNPDLECNVLRRYRRSDLLCL